jgi:hypothetical protein
MALTTRQKQGLLIGGTVLAVSLILFSAESAEAKKLGKKLIEDIKPNRPALPPPGERVTTPVVQEETVVRAETTAVPGCDPLLTPPEGMGCFETAEGEWALMPSINDAPPVEPKDSDLPTMGFRDIGVSNDYSAAKIGAHWEISVLHPFLEEERTAGRLAVMNHDSSVWDWLVAEPTSFVGDLVGSQAAGGAIYTALWITATGGVGTAAISGVGGEAILAGTRLSSAISKMAQWLGTGTTFTIAGKTITASALTVLVTEAMFEQSIETLRMWEEDDDLAGSAYEAFQKFRYTHRAIHGTHGDVWLKDLPWSRFPAMAEVQSEILLAIGRYQRRTFD